MNERHTDVNWLAKLSRLDLSPDEMASFPKQIPAILDYVGKLQRVKVTELAPPDLIEDPQRSDEAVVSHAIEQILAEAPVRNERFWQVKSVF